MAPAYAYTYTSFAESFAKEICRRITQARKYSLVPSYNLGYFIFLLARNRTRSTR